jgi:hypothetical protein
MRQVLGDYYASRRLVPHHPRNCPTIERVGKVKVDDVCPRAEAQFTDRQPLLPSCCMEGLSVGRKA